MSHKQPKKLRLEIVKTGIKYLFMTLFYTLLVIEFTLIISHYSNRDMPSNILGYTPYIIGQDDEITGLSKGSMMIAIIPNQRAIVGEVVSYINGNEIGIGKVVETGEQWYRVSNDDGALFITAHQLIGIRIMNFLFAGTVLQWLATHYTEIIMLILIGLFIREINWYCREKYLLIYKQKHKTKRRIFEMGKERNRKGSLILIGALLMTCAAAGTVAQYQTTLGGKDSAQVAAFKITSNELNKSSDADIKLFDTIKESNLSDAETDVSSGKIAPGTGGETTITVTNDSDVVIKSTLELKIENNGLNVPLELSTDGNTWQTIDNLSSLTELGEAEQNMSNTKERKINLKWRWALQKNTDVADTTIGENEYLASATNQPTVKVTLTAVQKD